ncbi:MAG: hypothetical protein WCL39_02135 [Armatimonadota bacterium]
MLDIKLSRLVRTPSSEVYLIWDTQEHRIGQLHLHYSHDTIHATLVFEMELSPTDEEALLATIDEDIVSSYLPSFDREDLFVTIFRGEEISSFSYASSGMDDDDFESDEPAG